MRKIVFSRIVHNICPGVKALEGCEAPGGRVTENGVICWGPGTSIQVINFGLGSQTAPPGHQKFSEGVDIKFCPNLVSF